MRLTCLQNRLETHAPSCNTILTLFVYDLDCDSEQNTSEPSCNQTIIDVAKIAATLRKYTINGALEAPLMAKNRIFTILRYSQKR